MCVEAACANRLKADSGLWPTLAQTLVHEAVTAIARQVRLSRTTVLPTRRGKAVNSLLGPPSKDLGRVDVAPILDGYRNVVLAMKRTVSDGWSRSAPSITDPADRREPAFSILVAVGKLIQPKAYRTMVGIGQIVRASDLDWTIVRVPLLTDGPRSERINVRTGGDKGGIRLSSANAAAYFLQQAEDTTRFGQAPLITDT